MSIKAMITVDLNNTNDLQRKEFNDNLEKTSWFSKIKKLSTTWEFSYVQDISDKDLMKIIKQLIHSAAKGAVIEKYKAAVMLGLSSPEVFCNE